MDYFLQAIVRFKSRADIEADLKAALNAMTSGVVVTSYSFEGQNTTFSQNMKPAELVELLQRAINYLDGQRETGGRFPTVDFSWRKLEA
jgi:uncharacterized protein (DUF1501 family)